MVIKILANVYGLCYHRSPQEPFVLKPKGYAEQAPPFTGTGIVGPAPHWSLQQECWLCPSWESCLLHTPHRHTCQGMTTLPLTMGLGEVIPVTQAQKSRLCLSLRETVPEGHTESSATTQAHILTLGLVYLIIYPIYHPFNKNKVLRPEQRILKISGKE